jgi:hypothetical protein
MPEQTEITIKGVILSGIVRIGRDGVLSLIPEIRQTGAQLCVR